MNDQRMVVMANQIATYYQSYSEPQARAGVRDHINKFWPPHMRQQLIDYGGEGLHPLVTAALPEIRKPAPVEPVALK